MVDHTEMPRGKPPTNVGSKGRHYVHTIHRTPKRIVNRYEHEHNHNEKRSRNEKGVLEK